MLLAPHSLPRRQPPRGIAPAQVFFLAVANPAGNPLPTGSRIWTRTKTLSLDAPEDSARLFSTHRTAEAVCLPDCQLFRFNVWAQTDQCLRCNRTWWVESADS